MQVQAAKRVELYLDNPLPIPWHQCPAVFYPLICLYVTVKTQHAKVCATAHPRPEKYSIRFLVFLYTSRNLHVVARFPLLPDCAVRDYPYPEVIQVRTVENLDGVGRWPAQVLAEQEHAIQPLPQPLRH